MHMYKWRTNFYSWGYSSMLIYGAQTLKNPVGLTPQAPHTNRKIPIQDPTLKPQITIHEKSEDRI